MHHVIIPSQSIVSGTMAAAAIHSNKTMAFNEPVCSLFIIFPYYSDDLSNVIYIFNYLNKLFADYRHPFVQNIHCIATRVVKGSQFSPRSSIFHFEIRSQMNLVSSLFFKINHKILRSIQWYKLFSDLLLLLLVTELGSSKKISSGAWRLRLKSSYVQLKQ